MARTVPLDDLPLSPPRDGETRGVWLDRSLREAIRTGQLKPGERLPSSRRLAAQHGAARGTVMEVFARLLDEGYLESRQGSGTRVAARLPEQYFTAEKPVRVAAKPAAARLSARGSALTDSPFLGTIPSPRPYAFRCYQPSVAEFPADVWARLGARRMRRASREMLLLGDELGWWPLREAVAAHLGSSRGVVCDPARVMIVSGTQQALDLTARLLLAPGDAVWMEDPGYAGATAILRAAGAKLVPVPVDDHGLQVSTGRRRAPQAKLVYITPANQFPLGMALSLERRLALVEWARQAGAWIFEDDYDSEFRFAGRPLAAVQGLDPGGNVIFACSFNKMLFPTLRLGAVVLPEPLVEPMRSARSLLDRYPPMLEQQVLCDFITEGHFGKHLRRMRQMYAERLDILTTGLSTFGDRLRPGSCDTGLQTTAWFPTDGNTDDRTISKLLSAHGVEATPLSLYSLRWPHRNGLHLGFGAVTPREIRSGLEVLKRVLMT